MGVSPLHEWTVAGGLVCTGSGVLLVRNRRHGGRVDWTPPGGVIDAGEELIGGLTREVEEETGITVTEWVGPLWTVEVRAPEMGWHLRAEVHRAVRYSGVLAVDRDPDGIVVDAEFVARPDCRDRLRSAHPWVAEPFLAWLSTGGRADPVAPDAAYRYEVAGADPATARVLRHPT